VVIKSIIFWDVTTRLHIQEDDTLQIIFSFQRSSWPLRKQSIFSVYFKNKHNMKFLIVAIWLLCTTEVMCLNICKCVYTCSLIRPKFFVYWFLSCQQTKQISHGQRYYFTMYNELPYKSLHVDHMFKKPIVVEMVRITS
jgi:hypothetical protein